MEMLPGKDEAIEPSLQKALVSMKVKYEQELYWLRLELSTSKREKEALEDQVSSLFRELQGFHDQQSVGSVESIDAAIAKDLQGQIHQQARLIETLNHQLDQMKSSTKTVVAILKDELHDLSTEKSKLEASLLGEVASLEKRLKAFQSKAQPGKEDMELLCESFKASQIELRHSEESLRSLQTENAMLRQRNEKLSGDLLLLRSSSDSIQHLNFLKKDRKQSLEALERVGTIWTNVHDSVQDLQANIDGLKEDVSQKPTLAGERLLSILEAASLVHGQVKVSLLLVESKLRNSLASLLKDSESDLSLEEQGKLLNAAKCIEENAMSAIREVSNQFIEEFDRLRRETAARVSLGDRIQAKQAKIEDQLVAIERQEDEEAKSDIHDEATMPCSVSRQVMDELQREVFRVVESLGMKNQEISKLMATVKEHEIRENLLAGEVERLRIVQAAMKDYSESSSDGDSESSNEGCERKEEGKKIEHSPTL